MKILVVNAGSSSLKYQLIDMDGEIVLAKGNCERIGIDGLISYSTYEGAKISYECTFANHKDAMQEVAHLMTESENKVIKNINEVKAIGQRVAHGGEYFSESVLITPEVEGRIKEISDLAPLHNPAALMSINACKKIFGADKPQIAVFDTAFHRTMEEKAFLFAIPYEYYEKYHIRRYGFHGTSHRYVSQRFFQITGQNPVGSKIISCHLGNGSSLAAIQDGRVMDTSMGFTPLDGFIMGTRSGEIDPSILTYLEEKEKLTPQQMNDILNKKSGMLGLSGVSGDNRDVYKAAEAGNKRAILATRVQTYQIRKFLGSYAAAMGGVDAVIFTGGIGENDTNVRYQVCRRLEFLGLLFDDTLNKAVRGEEKCLSKPYSRVQCWVIPTNEELMIARDTCKIIEETSK